MPGLVPGIHVFHIWQHRKTWMAGTSPAMTKWNFSFGFISGNNPPHRRLPSHLFTTHVRELMRTRYLVSGALAAALLSAPAFAQTSTTNPPAAPAVTPKADVGNPKVNGA